MNRLDSIAVVQQIGVYLHKKDMVELSDFTILFPNGKMCRYNIYDFEEFNSVNELEHNSENIILNTKDLNKSFAYEIDEFGEMTNKEPIRILIGQHS